MGLKIWFVVIVATLTCLIATGNGLSCYSCNTGTDSNCGDPFNSAQISTVNCTSGTTCYKGDAEAGGVEYVIRGCGSLGNTCTTTLGVEYCYSSCDTDECNAATTTTISGAILFIACTVIHIWP